MELKTFKKNKLKPHHISSTQEIIETKLTTTQQSIPLIQLTLKTLNKKYPFQQTTIHYI